jgi:NADPH:quinone reductase-like Zn-dependent oxidoreductase
MKAAVYTRYGSPDVVQITDVEKPVPKDDEVLIKVRAASVNPADRHRYVEEGHARGKLVIAL